MEHKKYFTVKLCGDKKKIIKLGSIPRVYWKVTGLPWMPGRHIHIGYQNYIAYFNDKEVAVLQLDKFTAGTCIIHGWVLPQYCKPFILKELGKELIELFKDFSEFKKLIATVPAPARHAIRWLRNTGFEKEGVIKDAIYYGTELVDCILMTYKLGD